MCLPSRVLLAALFLLTACADAPASLGIGRSPASAQSESPLLAVTLSRIYAPTVLPQGATSFVEMRLGQGADIDLVQTPLYLMSQAGMAPLPQRTWTQKSVLRLEGAALTPLGLHANAGELAVVDGQLNMHAYSAWGTPPSTWSQSFVNVARGRNLRGTKIPGILTYPLDANVAVNLDPDINALCLSADPNVDSQSTQAQLACPAAASALQLSRVQPAGLDTGGGWVEIYNAGGIAVDLHGATLCIDQTCGPIEAFHQDPNASRLTGVIGAGANANTVAGSLDPARAVINIGHTATLSSGAVAPLSTPGLSMLSPQSEVALFAPGVDPNSTLSAALSYLRLGASAQTPLPLLAQAQSPQTTAWSKTGLTAPRIRGESQARNTSTPNSLDPNGWALSSSTPGTAIADPATPWTSCSKPQNSASPQDLLRIVQLAQDSTWRVILQNTGAQTVDTSTYTLALGTQRFALTGRSVQLAAGATLWIELSSAVNSACSMNQDLCWIGALAHLEAGAITLLNETTPVGYVQWAPSAASGPAVSQGIWPAENCVVFDFSPAPAGTLPYRALRLLDGASGQSPADYVVGSPTRP